MPVPHTLCGFHLGFSLDGVTVKPHDLRRTYAKAYYDAGGDLVSLSQQLGHESTATTLGYIGEMDADKRAPPEMYNPWQQ